MVKIIDINTRNIDKSVLLDKSVEVDLIQSVITKPNSCKFNIGLRLKLK